MDKRLLQPTTPPPPPPQIRTNRCHRVFPQKRSGIYHFNPIKPCVFTPFIYIFLYIYKHTRELTTTMNVLQQILSYSQVSLTTTSPFKMFGFEDILEIQKIAASAAATTTSAMPSSYIMINTLSLTEQSILICRTIAANEEETILNQLLDTYQTSSVKIVIYGRNSADTSVFVKHNQIRKLGFTNVYIYMGGLFEWLLLQDIYGKDAFPTTAAKCSDILQFSAKKTI